MTEIIVIVIAIAIIYYLRQKSAASSSTGSSQLNLNFPSQIDFGKGKSWAWFILGLGALLGALYVLYSFGMPKPMTNWWNGVTPVLPTGVLPGGTLQKSGEAVKSGGKITTDALFSVSTENILLLLIILGAAAIISFIFWALKPLKKTADGSAVSGKDTLIGKLTFLALAVVVLIAALVAITSINFGEFYRNLPGADAAFKSYKNFADQALLNFGYIVAAILIVVFGVSFLSGSFEHLKSPGKGARYMLTGLVVTALLFAIFHTFNLYLGEDKSKVFHGNWVDRIVEFSEKSKKENSGSTPSGKHKKVVERTVASSIIVYKRIEFTVPASGQSKTLYIFDPAKCLLVKPADHFRGYPETMVKHPTFGWTHYKAGMVFSAIYYIGDGQSSQKMIAEYRARNQCT